MGTKQLLLIALGVIIVGTAIAVSVDLFNSQFSGQIRDMSILQMHEIGTLATAYYAKPTDSGGGGGTYKGFKLPQSIRDDALTWKFDFRFGDNLLYFFMISKQFIYEGRPLYLLGLHREGKLESINLYDPEKKQWETLFSKTKREIR